MTISAVVFTVSDNNEKYAVSLYTGKIMVGHLMHYIIISFY